MNPVPVLLAASLIYWASPLGAAHCACGGDAFPGAAISAQTAGVGSVILSWGAGYTWHERVSRGDFEARARRPGGIGRFEGPQSLAAASLDLSWGLSQRWQIGLSQSWQRMEQYSEGVVDASGAYAHLEHGSLSGLKDLGLSTKVSLLDGAWGKAALQAEITLPTGAELQSPLSAPDASGTTGGVRARPLPQWVQPGKGALGASFAAAYTFEASSWLADISYAQTIPSTVGDYRYGTRGTWAGSLGWKARGHDILYADLIWAQSESDSANGKRVWATGGAFVGVGPRASISVSSRSQATLQLLWPLLFGTAGEEGTRASLQAAARLSTQF